MTADPSACRPRLDGKGGHPIQAIAQHQGPLGQLRQQPLRQRPFGFALATDRGGQGIVQAQFQQHRRRDLRKRRAAATRLRFDERGRDLRRVDQTELRAVEGDQPPPSPERLAMVPDGRAGSQCPPHQVRKDLPRQAESPIRPRTVGERLAEQLEQVVGQCPGVLHDVKGQRRQQLIDRDARFAPATARHRWHALRSHQAVPRGEKAGCRFARGRDVVLSRGM